MDKEYQDIFYVNRIIERVDWRIYCVHVITIAFGNDEIKIDYREMNGTYQSKTLKKKKRYHLEIY